MNLGTDQKQVLTRLHYTHINTNAEGMRTRSLLRFKGKWLLRANNMSVDSKTYYVAHIGYARDQLVKKGKRKSGWLKGLKGSWY
jgi:hypothetical protein